MNFMLNMLFHFLNQLVQTIYESLLPYRHKAVMKYERPKMKKRCLPKMLSFSQLPNVKRQHFWRASLFIFGHSYFIRALAELFNKFRVECWKSRFNMRSSFKSWFLEKNGPKFKLGLTFLNQF